MLYIHSTAYDKRNLNKKNDDDSVVLMCRTCRGRMIFNYVDLVGAIEQDYHCPRIGWMMMNKVWNKCKNNEQIRN